MSDLVTPKNVDINYETETPILYEVIDNVAWITMDRPAFNNAQNGQMTYALDDAFNRAVKDDDVRCIVLAGNGKHFCAGLDLGMFANLHGTSTDPARRAEVTESTPIATSTRSARARRRRTASSVSQRVASFFNFL